jgi:hypothetical protein
VKDSLITGSSSSVPLLRLRAFQAHLHDPMPVRPKTAPGEGLPLQVADKRFADVRSQSAGSLDDVLELRRPLHDYGLRGLHHFAVTRMSALGFARSKNDALVRVDCRIAIREFQEIALALTRDCGQVHHHLDEIGCDAIDPGELVVKNISCARRLAQTLQLMTWIAGRRLPTNSLAEDRRETGDCRFA